MQGVGTLRIQIHRSPEISHLPEHHATGTHLIKPRFRVIRLKHTR